MNVVMGPEPTTSVRMFSEEPPGATLRAGRWCALAGALGLMTAHCVNAFVLDRAVPGLDANQEGTPLVWASAVATWTVAVAAFVAATLRTGPLPGLLFVGCATAFFSLDDMVGVHERLARILVLEFGVADAWGSALLPMVYLPLLAVTAVLILRMARCGNASTFRDAVIGLCLLVAAVALNVVSAPWVTETGLIYTIQGGIEEAMELAGWILLASSTLGATVIQVMRRAISTTGIR